MLHFIKTVNKNDGNALLTLYPVVILTNEWKQSILENVLEQSIKEISFSKCVLVTYLLYGLRITNSDDV